MSVAEAARVTYAGNGSTTSFAGLFRVDAATGVGVSLRTDADLTIVEPVLNTDYTVTLDANNLPTVVFTTAPASGTTVILYPKSTITQDTSVTPGGPQYGDAIQAALDNLAANDQRLFDLVGQCVRFAAAAAAVSQLSGHQAAMDKYLFFNATTGQPEFKDLAVVQADLGMLGADLTVIEALTPSNDDVMQRKAGAWANRTLAQLWADLDGILPDTLAFSADTDTDINRPGANRLQLRVGGSAALEVNADGQTLPLQPAFVARLSADQANVTGNGTAADLICDTEVNDRGADYNNANGVFTAPVTGFYLFSASVAVIAGGAATDAVLNLVATGLTYRLARLAAGAVDISGAFTLAGAALVYLTAAQTAKITVTVTGEGADTTDLDGDTDARTFFSGWLVA